jgi:hypothetical protein
MKLIPDQYQTGWFWEGYETQFPKHFGNFGNFGGPKTRKILVKPQGLSCLNDLQGLITPYHSNPDPRMTIILQLQWDHQKFFDITVIRYNRGGQKWLVMQYFHVK